MRVIEKALPPEKTPAPCARLLELEARMSAFEANLRQLDERTHRGERLLMEMQLEQRHMARVLEAVAAKLDVPPQLPPPVSER